MNRLALIGILPLLLAAPAAAQTADHGGMDHWAMHHGAPPPGATEAHAHPDAAPAADGAAASPDPHAGHAMPADPPADTAAAEPPAAPAGEIPHSPPPTAPADHAADRFYPPAVMDAARAQLRRDHGGGAGAVPYSMFMASLAEHQTRSGADGYRWEGQAWFGGDINRLVLKTEGEATRGEGVEAAELQGLYSRAVGAYTDLQFGVRQDFEPRGRTYATVGFESLLPYWFDVEGAVFLSTKGELLGRLEATYELRLTNRLILQPRAEFNFAAQDTPATRTGSGLSSAELGLRLRYEFRREFAPYVGVSWDRKAGGTAGYARALGQDVEAASVVVGIRAFF